MSPEEHITEILTAWKDTDGYSISHRMNEALENAWSEVESPHEH